jgi:AmmeMemoRadiSam system protein B/AmmeMemoRadiSam system protein A
MFIRKAAVAGQFYEADPDKLRKEVSSYLGVVKPAKGQVLGVLAPHAGYAYSGATAGAAFSFLKDMDFDTVVIIGTGHTETVKGAAIMTEGVFETPLGRVEIDAVLARILLASSKLFEDRPSAHAREHSIEVELPFLQTLGKPFKLVPVVANTDDVKTLEEIGRLIGKTLKGRKAVICVSSDLSHYPPGPVAEMSDLSLLEAFATAVRNRDMGYFGLANALLSEKSSACMDTAACGFSAMVIGAAACLEAGANDFQLLKYTHSGMISGQAGGVVGYGAGLFTAGGRPEPRILGEKVKAGLLALARASIDSRLKKIKVAPPPLSACPEFNQPAAVFVTLTKKGALRGCIGTMTPGQLLSDAVAHFAAASAFEDSRFPQLSRAEMAEVRIEISVLSPLRRVDSWKDVEEGRHGVYVQKGRLGGTYLPQVWEHFDSKEKFLSSLCLEKAGLPPDAWNEKSTALYVYTVDSFEEK